MWPPREGTRVGRYQIVLLQTLEKGQGGCVRLSAAIFPQSFFIVTSRLFSPSSSSCESACLTVPSLTDEFFLRISECQIIDCLVARKLVDDRCRIAILHCDGRGRENYLNESSLYKKNTEILHRGNGPFVMKRLLNYQKR